MYNIECLKEFDLQLDVPEYGERFAKLFTKNKKKVAYFKNEFDNSTFRYRCINIVESMKDSEKYEVTYFLCKEINRILPYINNIDLIIFQRISWMPEVENLVDLAHKNNIRVVYDMDDLYFEPSHAVSYINHVGKTYTEDEVRLYFGYITSHWYAARKCDAFIATVPLLAKAIGSSFNKEAIVIPNFVNYEQISESEYVLEKRIYNSERFHIGYFSGSMSHIIDLRTIENDLIALMEKYDDIDIVIVGYMQLPERFLSFQKQGRIIFRDFVPFQQLQYEIGRVDVNIAPLVSDDFNEAKSELKFFEAGFVKVPSCVADTQVYRSVVNNGEDGFVCGQEDWFNNLERLYLDKELRKNMAEKAYKTAHEKYTPSKMTSIITDAYDHLLEDV